METTTPQSDYVSNSETTQQGARFVESSYGASHSHDPAHIKEKKDKIPIGPCKIGPLVHRHEGRLRRRRSDRPSSPIPPPFSASPSPEQPPAKPRGRKDGGGGALLVSSRSGGLGSLPGMDWRWGRAMVAAEVSAPGGVVGDGDGVGAVVVVADPAAACPDPAAARRPAVAHPAAATGVLRSPSRRRPALVIRHVIGWGRGGLESGRRAGGVNIAGTLGVQVTFGVFCCGCYG
uniref:Uncharacterized protein n=1 Tax=Oryza nivara TaxID=4536 RepID=A0A0E0HD09_ORYNI